MGPEVSKTAEEKVSCLRGLKTKTESPLDVLGKFWD